MGKVCLDILFSHFPRDGEGFTLTKIFGASMFSFTKLYIQIKLEFRNVGLGFLGQGKV